MYAYNKGYVPMPWKLKTANRRQQLVDLLR